MMDAECLDLGDNHENEKKEDEFGKYCETDLAGLARILQWEMREKKAFGMTSRFSSLGNPSSG